MQPIPRIPRSNAETPVESRTQCGTDASDKTAETPGVAPAPDATAEVDAADDRGARRQRREPESAEPADAAHERGAGRSGSPTRSRSTQSRDAEPVNADENAEPENTESVDAESNAEPFDAVAILDAAGRSRADLQAELRKSHKKEKKRKHRWRRRAIYALSAIVLIAALGAGGIYFYARYRYDQIKKIHAKHLVAQPAAPGQPFNILVVGSDSRAFVGDNRTLTSELGNESDTGGQRSDVTMVARFDPANKTVTVLSIPRDLWVDIPGNDSGISGMNRINAAYDAAPTF